MTIRIDRRTAIKATLGGATLVGLGTVGFAPAAHAQDATLTLGMKPAEFEAALGKGESLTDKFVRYGEPTADAPAYYVRYSDQGAEYIEADFTGFEGGGRQEEDAEVGTSRFLPADAAPITNFNLGRTAPGPGTYSIQTYHSDSLATDTGRSGNLLVMDEMDASDSMGSGINLIYPRANVSMEKTDTWEFAPTQSKAKLWGAVSDWEAVYGPSTAAQTGESFDIAHLGNVTLSTKDANVAQIDVITELPLDAAAVTKFVNESLPEGAEIYQTHYATPTETGPIGVRLQVWQAGEQWFGVQINGTDGNDVLTSRIVIGAM